MDSVLTRDSFDPKQHYTQPPAHYTEATLVKTLEELGIGRPSTYAPTISIISDAGMSPRKRKISILRRSAKW